MLPRYTLLPLLVVALLMPACASNSADDRSQAEGTVAHEEASSPTSPESGEEKANPEEQSAAAQSGSESETTAGEVPAEEPPAEGSPAEGSPAEEPPVEESPAEESLDPEAGQTEASVEVLRTLTDLRDNVQETRYTGRLDIDPESGSYAWDCSGMAGWILKRSAPRARKAMKKKRPLASHFYRAIRKAPTDRAKRGWQQLEHVSDARPGDLFSWLRSPISKSKITGHVGFFVEQPRPLEDYPNIYIARIADSTSVPHGNDTRNREGDGGFGFGTLLFATDENGETYAYGWHGRNSLLWGFMPAKVIYGRVSE